MSVCSLIVNKIAQTRETCLFSCCGDVVGWINLVRTEPLTETVAGYATGIWSSSRTNDGRQDRTGQDRTGQDRTGHDRRVIVTVTVTVTVAVTVTVGNCDGNGNGNGDADGNGEGDGNGNGNSNSGMPRCWTVGLGRGLQSMSGCLDGMEGERRGGGRGEEGRVERAINTEPSCKH